MILCAVFLVSEAQGGKVRNPKKLQSVKQMLNVYMQDEDVVANGDDTDDTHRIETTVFELAGYDKAGLLADVMQLLTHNGCDVRSAAVWTYNGRVAFVFSVTEKGKPVVDETKLHRLRQMVEQILLNAGGSFTVNTQRVRGEVHHDRRLHRLMLAEERQEWERQHAGQSLWPVSNGLVNGFGKENGRASSPTDSVMSVHAGDEGSGPEEPRVNSPFRSPKYDKPTIDIGHCRQPNYWTVNITCRDRTKLLFDTVCTLADLEFDIYHATIDTGSDGWAHQEFFLRPRSGDGDFSPQAAAMLRAMLDSSIQRRFPKGIKVHVKSVDRFGCLASLARQLQVAGLTVTRAKARTFAQSNSSGHTLYVMDAHGGPPDRASVQHALMQCGGRLSDTADLGDMRAGHQDARFSFTFSANRNGSSVSTYGDSPDSFYGSL